MHGIKKRLLAVILLVGVLTVQLARLEAWSASASQQTTGVSITLRDREGPVGPGGGGSGGSVSGGGSGGRQERLDDPTLVQVLPPEVPAADILGPLPVTGSDAVRTGAAAVLLLLGAACLAGGWRRLCRTD